MASLCINTVMYKLYKTTNTINGRYYIGVSNGNKKSYKGSGTALKVAIKKYGNNKFTIETLEEFDTAEAAFAREAEVVNEDFVNNNQTYNIKVGGKGGTGQKKSRRHRQNLSVSIKDKYRDDIEYQKNCGRNVAMDTVKLVKTVNNYGVKKAAEKLNLTFHQCKGRYYRAKKRPTS